MGTCHRRRHRLSCMPSRASTCRSRHKIYMYISIALCGANDKYAKVTLIRWLSHRRRLWQRRTTTQCRSQSSHTHTHTRVVSHTLWHFHYARARNTVLLFECRQSRRRSLSENRLRLPDIASSLLVCLVCRMYVSCAACKLYSDGLYLLHLIGLQMNINIYKIVVFKMPLRCECELEYFKSSALYSVYVRGTNCRTTNFVFLCSTNERARKFNFAHKNRAEKTQRYAVLWCVRLKCQIQLAMCNTIENDSAYTHTYTSPISSFRVKQIAKRKSKRKKITANDQLLNIGRVLPFNTRIVIMCSMRCSILSR